MRISFRQGIVGAQPDFLNSIGSNIWIRTSDNPTLVTIAQGSHNYIHYENADVLAWTGPFTPSTHYWLYWDFDPRTFARTFGYTVVEPVVSSITPTSAVDSYGVPGLILNRHWFNTITNTMMVYDGTSWRQVLRVFAAHLYNSNFTSMSVNAPDFRGTQIGNVNSVVAGRVLFDENGHALTRLDRSFITTEDQLFAAGARVDGVRLESNVSMITMFNTVSAYSVVAISSDVGFGRARTAIYEDIGEAAIAMITQDTLANDVGSVIFQGVVTNDNWTWPIDAIGKPLWVDNGILTLTDPFISSPLAHINQKPPVARVISADTVIFEQGLGQKGEKGENGDGTFVPVHASTLVYGEVKLVTAEPNSLVVSDSDPRLTDARVPLLHSHPASQVTFTPGHNIGGTNVQTALENVGDTVLFKSGGSMTGQLLLATDPTASLQAATKSYVDSKVFGLIWLSPIELNNIVADNATIPPMIPHVSDSYILGVGATGLWSGLDNHIVTWNGISWQDDGLLPNFPVGTRFGIAFETPTTPTGTFAGKKNQIAVLGAGSSWTFEIPVDGNAVYVNSDISLHAYHQYAFNLSVNEWIEFGGSTPVPRVAELLDVVAPTPIAGDVLTFDGVSWVNDKPLDAVIVFQIGSPPPATHYHFAYLTKQQAEALITGTVTFVNITSTQQELHTHTITVEFNPTDSNFVVTNITNNTLDNHIANPVHFTLSALNDVFIDTPIFNQILKYNGTKWVNGILSIPNTLPDLSDVGPWEGLPVAGDILRYDGFQWLPNAIIIPQVLDDLTDVTLIAPSNNQFLTYYNDGYSTYWTNTTVNIPTVLNDLSNVEAVVGVPDGGSLLVYDELISTWVGSNSIPINIHGQTFKGPALVGYSEVLSTQNISISNITLDLDVANSQEIVLQTNITALNLLGTFNINRTYSLTLIVKQDAVGSRTITWPANFKWGSGVPAVLTATANAIDIFTILTTDAGANWYAFPAGINMS